MAAIIPVASLLLGLAWTRAAAGRDDDQAVRLLLTVGVTLGSAAQGVLLALT